MECVTLDVARSVVTPPGGPRTAMTQCTRHERSATTRRGGTTTCARRAGHTQDGESGCRRTREAREAEELGTWRALHASEWRQRGILTEGDKVYSKKRPPQRCLRTCTSPIDSDRPTQADPLRSRPLGHAGKSSPASAIQGTATTCGSCCRHTTPRSTPVSRQAPGRHASRRIRSL